MQVIKSPFFSDIESILDCGTCAKLYVLNMCQINVFISDFYKFLIMFISEMNCGSWLGISVCWLN